MAFGPLAVRSHQIWPELEAATGERLMVNCGGVVIGPEDAANQDGVKPRFLARTLEVAEALGIEHEILDRTALAARFPQFTGLRANDIAYFEPEAGFLYPEACIRAQLTMARRLGAITMINNAVTGIEQDGTRVVIATANARVEAAFAVVSAGAWVARLLGAPFDRFLRPTRQVLHWFEAKDPALYAPSRFPIFIRKSEQISHDVYGFPTPEGTTGVKIATEDHADYTDPDTLTRTVTPAEASTFYTQYLAGRFAGISSRVLRSKVCLYTEAPGVNFLIDRHPTMAGVQVISACSGHGFKHSAAIGEAVAERLFPQGIGACDLSPFALARFSAHI
jgi:sarcosine oxidase